MSAMEAEAVEMGQATLLQDSTGHCGFGPLMLTQVTALPTPCPHMLAQPLWRPHVPPGRQPLSLEPSTQTTLGLSSSMMALWL